MNTIDTTNNAAKYKDLPSIGVEHTMAHIKKKINKILLPCLTIGYRYYINLTISFALALLDTGTTNSSL